MSLQCRHNAYALRLTCEAKAVTSMKQCNNAQEGAAAGTQSEIGISSENIEFLQRHGFLVLRNVLPPEQVDALHDIVEELFKTENDGTHDALGGHVVRPYGGNGCIIRSLVNTPPNASARELFLAARRVGDAVARDVLHDEHKWAGHADLQ